MNDTLDQPDIELSQLVRAQAARHRAPPHLLKQIEASLTNRDTPPMVKRTKPAPTPWWRMPWLTTGAAFACGVLLSMGLLLNAAGPSADDRATQELVADHVRSLQVAHLADVVSTDQHTVKPWFSGKLDFSPPVHDLASEGFALIGGRLDYAQNRTVAALVYGRQQHRINLFVWPADTPDTPSTTHAVVQGFNVVHWRQAHMNLWAVSDLGATELQQFAQLMRGQMGG